MNSTLEALCLHITYIWTQDSTKTHLGSSILLLLSQISIKKKKKVQEVRLLKDFKACQYFGRILVK